MISIKPLEFLVAGTGTGVTPSSHGAVIQLTGSGDIFTPFTATLVHSFEGYNAFDFSDPAGQLAPGTTPKTYYGTATFGDFGGGGVYSVTLP